MNPELREKLLIAQKNEITEYHVYSYLANLQAGNNKKVLLSIAKDELSHYNFWKKYTKEEVKYSKWKYVFFTMLARMLGLTFALRFMERGEENAQINYNTLTKYIAEAKKIVADENEHENELLKIIDEKKLKYIGSIVLGLNDALVELTGALAGFTIALRDSRVIAAAGLVTGIAAAMSMAASEYLSTKSEKQEKNPITASIYTGIAYIFTVFLLILPFLLISNVFVSMVITMSTALLIILAFTFYISVAQDTPFGRRFAEMAILSFSVAGISFVIGTILSSFLHV